MTQNICFFISDLEKSGGTQRILSILCNLLINHYDIYIIVNYAGEPFFNLDKRVNIIQLPRFKYIHLLRNWFIYNILKKYNIKTYISLDSNSILLNSLLLPKKTKLVLWEHFSLTNNFNKLHFIVSRHYAVLRCSSLILISEHEMSEWGKYNFLATEKSKLIYNPLSIDESDIDTSSRYHLKSFLAIGNNIDVKGFDILLKAWKDLKTEWLLKIVGLNEESIKRLNIIIKKNSLNNVQLYGREREITKFYKTSSVFLLPSRKEATPLVLIESQAYGMPAIVFNHLPGVLELIDNSAIITNYDESGKSFKKAIASIIEDEVLYNKLHSNAIKNSLRFTKTEFKDRWIKLLS